MLFNMLCRLFIIATLLLLGGLHAQAQSPAGCNATKEHPVQICFNDPPLTVDHCKGMIDLHFRVELLPFENGIKPAYYFTYQLSTNGVLDKIEDPLDGKFLVTESDPFLQTDAVVNIPYEHPEKVSVIVTVYAEGRTSVTATSSITPLDDSVRVTALTIGISHYALDVIPQLIHPDDDAKAFDTFLKAVIPQGLHTTLLTSDAVDASKQPTVQNIADVITNEKLAPYACSNDDWFIFYFSGHGVVGSNEQLVGNKGAVATHYLSTALLDPSNLDATAIPIEDILHWIRHLPAGNKVVILDSCFSGSSKRLQSTSASNSAQKGALLRAKSNKVAYVFGKNVVDPYEFASRNPSSKGGDLLVFKEVATQEERDQRRGLFLSASVADHVAEEGFEQYGEPGLTFTPADDESDEQKRYGHGLYTFVLLWNLLAQMPKDANLPEILRGQQPSLPAAGGCQIDFSAAHQIGAGDIAKLQRNAKAAGHAREYQAPEIAGQTQTVPPALPCRVLNRNDTAGSPNESQD